jgi:hypothetical protein
MTLEQRISKLEVQTGAVSVDRDNEALPHVLRVLDMHPEAKASVVMALERASEQDETAEGQEALPLILSALDRYPDVKGEVLEALEKAKQ